MGTIADVQEVILDEEEIRDALAHYTDWVYAGWLEGVTFFIVNDLDQNVAYVIEGHYDPASADASVDVVGGVGNVAANDTGADGVHRTSTNWLWAYRLRITAAGAPAAGDISVHAIKQLRMRGGQA